MKALTVAATAVALVVAAPAAAQPSGPGRLPEPKVSELFIYGDDPCPESTNETITVCYKLKEGDRYRIPENLRSDPNDPANQAWAARATAMEFVGRSGIGSCSTTGPGGMTGCFSDLVHAYRAERNSPDNVNWNLLVEEARKERLSKIDAEAKAADVASQAPPAAAPPPPQ
jgi:hypothetical protein